LGIGDLILPMENVLSLRTIVLPIQEAPRLPKPLRYRNKLSQTSSDLHPEFKDQKAKNNNEKGIAKYPA
jgi:hypothetical protein